MELVDAHLSDMGSEFKELIMSRLKKVESTISRSLGVPEIRIDKLVIITTKMDEFCLMEVMSPYDVKDCDLEVLIYSRLNDGHYLVITSNHFTKLFGRDFRKITPKEVKSLGGEEMFSIMADLYDRVVASALFFGLHVFLSVMENTAAGAIPSFLQRADMFERMLSVYETMDVIAVELYMD